MYETGGDAKWVKCDQQSSYGDMSREYLKAGLWVACERVMDGNGEETAYHEGWQWGLEGGWELAYALET